MFLRTNLRLVYLSDCIAVLAAAAFGQTEKMVIAFSETKNLYKIAQKAYERADATARVKVLSVQKLEIRELSKDKEIQLIKKKLVTAEVDMPYKGNFFPTETIVYYTDADRRQSLQTGDTRTVFAVNHSAGNIRGLFEMPLDADITDEFLDKEAMSWNKGETFILNYSIPTSDLVAVVKTIERKLNLKSMWGRNYCYTKFSESLPVLTAAQLRSINLRTTRPQVCRNRIDITFIYASPREAIINFYKPGSPGKFVRLVKVFNTWLIADTDLNTKR